MSAEQFYGGHVVVPESKAGMKILIRQIKTVNRFTNGCLQKQCKGTLPKAFCFAPGELAQKRAVSWRRSGQRVDAESGRELTQNRADLRRSPLMPVAVEFTQSVHPPVASTDTRDGHKGRTHGTDTRDKGYTSYTRA